MNCAVTISTGEKLVDMSVDTIQHEIAMNILGNFYTVKEFLPGMLKLERGHIVTVSSALGFCGPTRLLPSFSPSFLSRSSNSFPSPLLGVFCSCVCTATSATAKAGLLSFHESLTAELSLYSPVKTTLVVAGQSTHCCFMGSVRRVRLLRR